MSGNLVFKRTVFKVDVYGKSFDVRRPTGLEKDEYLAKTAELERKVLAGEEVKENEDYDITVEFLEKLGLPEEVFREMEGEHQLDLIVALISKKKA